MNGRDWKSVARRAVAVLPDNGRFVRGAYRSAKLLRFRLLIKLRHIISKDSIADPETIYWISPNRIEFYTNYRGSGLQESQERTRQRMAMQDFRAQVFDRDKDKGKIYAGDWDISEFRFEELEVYKALKARICDSTPWKETDFYKTMVARIDQGSPLWGCADEAAFVKRCNYLDRLIESIRDNGYKLNSDVLIEGDDPHALTKQEVITSEVLVNIGRNGEYLFQDGRHRLAIAKILGLDSIPVKVVVRHRQWQELREHLSTMTKNSSGASKKGVLYQLPMHPDLKDFPATHACEDRFEVMREHLLGHGGNLLDVGANLGYFCHRCEDLGFKCYAIELLPEVVWAADRIRTAEKKEFRIVQGDLITAFESAPLKNIEFDTVITLNILHHFLRTKERYEQLRSWLQRLNVKRMFFEAHRTDEPHMVGAYANLEADQFVEFILENTSLTNAEFLSIADDGRKMYKLFS